MPRFRMLFVSPPQPSGGDVVASPSLTEGRASFGQVFPQGAVAEGLAVELDGITTQCDILNTWPDGSARHCVISADVPGDDTYDLVTTTPPGGSYTPTWPTATVAFDISGTTWTASLGSFDGTNTTLNGSVCRRSWVIKSPLNGATPHPLLQVIFEITSYAAGGHEVSFTVQNIKNVSDMDKVTYDVTVTLAGSEVFSKDSHVHYTGQRWHKVSWTGATESIPTHDFDPWFDSKVVPRIVGSATRAYPLDQPQFDLGGGTSGGIYYYGVMVPFQGDGGDREEIGFVMGWEGRLLALNTEHYRQVCLRSGDMTGEWSCHLAESDGLSVLRLDDPDYTDTVCTDAAIHVGLQWPTDGSTVWRGARMGTNSPSGTMSVFDRQHCPSACFLPYLLTGRKFYLDQMRFWSEWAIFHTYPDYFVTDTRFFPGLARGRLGDAGYLNDAGASREFAWPLKIVANCAWALPDGHGEKAYLDAIVENNLDVIGDYARYYIDADYGGRYQAIGRMEAPGTDHYKRTNTVSSTASGNPTVLTVVGDNSGVGTGTNDHGGQTGDKVELAGFGGNGAPLNGLQTITRLSATTFSVPVNTTGTTTGQGTYTFTQGFGCPPWRMSFSCYVIDWIERQGLWTVPADAHTFADRICNMFVRMNVDNPGFLTGSSGLSHPYYPSFCYIAGDVPVWFDDWATFKAYNESSSTSHLYDSQVQYTAQSSATHRGNVQGWNNSEIEIGTYNAQAQAVLAIAKRRGLDDAAAAHARQVGLSGHAADLLTRPQYNLSFGSEAD